MNGPNRRHRDPKDFLNVAADLDLAGGRPGLSVTRPRYGGCTIKSGRGTWPDDTAATCSGKVRTPRDGGAVSKKRVRGSFSGRNVGWHLWNISKRYSEAKATLRRARELVDDEAATAGWSEEGLATLERIRSRLEVCVLEADHLWSRLLETVESMDPGTGRAVRVDQRHPQPRGRSGDDAGGTDGVGTRTAVDRRSLGSRRAAQATGRGRGRTSVEPDSQRDPCNVGPSGRPIGRIPGAPRRAGRSAVSARARSKEASKVPAAISNNSRVTVTPPADHVPRKRRRE